MSQLEKIESQLAELSCAELAAFRKWFSEFDAVAWDQQFEADVKAGRLDALADAALTGERDEREVSFYHKALVEHP